MGKQLLSTRFNVISPNLNFLNIQIAQVVRVIINEDDLLNE